MMQLTKKFMMIYKSAAIMRLWGLSMTHYGDAILVHAVEFVAINCLRKLLKAPNIMCIFLIQTTTSNS